MGVQAQIPCQKLATQKPVQNGQNGHLGQDALRVVEVVENQE